MDKIVNGAKDFASIKQYLETINQTTDDFLFVCDIKNNQIQFFGSINDVFDIGEPGRKTITAEELFAIVHPADRKTVTKEFDKICKGSIASHDMNFRMFNKRGETVWVNSRCKLSRDENGAPCFMFGRLSEEAVRHLFNPITGLWNKTKLLDDLKNRFDAGAGWLMMLEIPMFADINLSHGSNFGNQLLCDVADIFEDIDKVEESYHIDHNNFAIILDAVSHMTVEAVYRKISDTLQDKCTLFAGVVPIDASVFLDVSQLIDCANITLKKASQNPIGGVEFFSAEEVHQRITSLMLLEEMKESVQNGFEGFEVYYQPQIKSESYEFHGVEALLRYNSPKRGRVFPDEFIPLLEQSGLIEPVGMWVLETALIQCKKWRESIPELQVAVNFSSVQFEDRRLGAKIIDALRRADLPGNALTVELTESVQLSGNKHYYDLIKYIKSYGVRFSIDDFGTGYSNLGYLKQLDVSEIKIDRSFVSEIEKNTYNYRLISNVIEFAKTNAIHACCEGVETAKELSILEPLKADIFQGYLFDKPCTADEIAQKYIHKNSDEYKARMATIEEIKRFKEQFGTIHFDPKNILRANDIGLWIIRVDEKNNRRELYVDDVMERVLGLTEKVSPSECYDYWYSRISHEDKEYVDHSVNVMIHDGKAVQLGYRWNHPNIGQVTVRSSGIRTSDESGKIMLEGYHRILTGVEGA
ncbi:MAG: EAL domain-containing protein [Ruminococcaceae bacterium]|nr:EAL domain-containing protein [Oscillospiraceae bacterium]